VRGGTPDTVGGAIYSLGRSRCWWAAGDFRWAHSKSSLRSPPVAGDYGRVLGAARNSEARKPESLPTLAVLSAHRLQALYLRSTLSAPRMDEPMVVAYSGGLLCADLYILLSTFQTQGVGCRSHVAAVHCTVHMPPRSEWLGGSDGVRRSFGVRRSTCIAYRLYPNQGKPPGQQRNPPAAIELGSRSRLSGAIL
jgi:hypothetical protein